MKKFNIVLLILFALSIALLAESNFSTNGVFRTRMMMYNADDDNGIGDPMFTHSCIDSRFRMSFINTFNEKIKGVLQIEIGDIIWGDAKKGGGFTTDGINIETKHAYLEFLCPKSKVNFRIGLQAWKEHRGLVLDGDMAAFLLSKNFRNLNVELGTAKFEENKLHKDDDVDIFFLNFTNNKYGIHNILRRSEGGDNIDVWFMPYFIHKMNEISLDITVIYNYGNYIETAAGDVTNNGYGIDIKATYDENYYTASFEFLYTSGEDEDDSESTTIFKTAGEHYCNGLEIFGRGTFDNFGAGWFGPEGKDNLGLMNITLSGSYPINDMMTAKAMLGYLNSAVENADGESNMGMEVDLGITCNIYEELTFDLVGASASVNEDFFGDSDSLYEVTGRFQYKF